MRSFADENVSFRRETFHAQIDISICGSPRGISGASSGSWVVGQFENILLYLQRWAHFDIKMVDLISRFQAINGGNNYERRKRIRVYRRLWNKKDSSYQRELFGVPE
jgi:hypothetical protein